MARRQNRISQGKSAGLSAMSKTLPRAIRTALPLVFLAAAIIAITNDCSEAVFTIKPAIALSEEFDDNIYLTRKDRVSDYITRVLPSVSMNYKAPIWDWTLDYTLIWWYYAKLRKGETSHDLKLTSKVNVINNLLYLDINDIYSNVVIDPRAPSTQTNLSVNRTDTNTLTVSPYFKYQLTPAMALSAGYRYSNIWYRDATAISRKMHTGFATVDYMVTPQVTASMSAEYVADRPERPEPNNDQKAVFSKVLYKMNPRMDLDATLGYRWYKFDVGPAGHSVSRPIYGAGLIYRISDTGRIEFRVGSTFTTSPDLGVLESRTEQITVRYGEALSIDGSIFHRKDTYVGTTTSGAGTTGFGITSKEDVYGITAGLQYKYNQRLTFRGSGKYEKDRFLVEDEGENNIFSGSAGIDYKLTPKATLTLTYNHTREGGRTRDLEYTDNVIAVQLHMTF